MQNKKISTVIIFLGLLISVGAVAWKQISSGFQLITGDGYDGSIANVITTHWYWVLRGERTWNEVGYFYPYADTLGYNDAYLIYGIIAAIYRIFTDNQFFAVELSHMTIRAVGYFSFYRFARYFKISKKISVLSAITFTIFYSATHTGHAQLLLVGISPLVLYFVAKAFDSINEKKFYKYAVLSSLLYGAVALTGFYITYFTTLYLILFILIYLCLKRSWINISSVMTTTFKITVWILFVLASLIPFFVVYLSKLKETGGHPYSEINKHLPKLQDIVNIGDHSLLWGNSIKQFLSGGHFAFGEGELRLGFGLFFFSLFTIASISILIKNVKVVNKFNIEWVAMIIATWMLILLVIDFGIGSIWSYVYSYIPGGKGLRVVSRIFIFLSIPTTLIIFKFVDDCLNKSNRVKEKLILGSVVFLVGVEQINTAPFVALDVNEQISFLAELKKPPNDCKSFYATNPSGFKYDESDIDTYYRVNVRAMLVSSFFNIPTVIGVASFAPPDWNFKYDPENTFDERVLKYVEKHNLNNNFCILDIKNRSWSNMKTNKSIK